MPEVWGKEVGEVEEREIIIRIYYVREKSIFNKRKRKMLWGGEKTRSLEL